MTLDTAVWVLIVTAIVLANIPWFFQNRLFLLLPVQTKSVWVNLVEWFVYFLLIGALAFMLEKNAMGQVQAQDWEFYAVTVFMFAIFSFPGFIYRYNLRRYLQQS
ncbi:DUF2818 family protein [Thiomicrospira sp. WB1]|uniref:DUF2818 family protein n=1 Tax=Thiomicrospira sp. WB1 TaxID=1685380 RepID=UPI00074874B8|nr:DUF2818 family protein [Thiomicrospira sp. WB1]KUJ71848.1 hypothetical protein AVO41_05145 [Thiomicrospira sp. WB1]